MSRKTILITGASGFTGQHALHYFKNKGYHVFGTARTSENEEIMKANLTDREEVFSLVKHVQPDYVLHLAGQNAVKASWEKPLATFDANLVATLHVLEALRNHQSEAKIVVVGSALEDGLAAGQLSSHPYGLSKTMQSWAAKNWAELFDMHIVVAKPTNLIGPGFANGVCAVFAEKIANMEKNNQPGTVTIANQAIKRDFLDVRDAVSGYELLLQQGCKGEVYEMGSGEFVSLETIAQIYQEMARLAFHVAIQQQPAQLTVPALNMEKLYEIGWRPMMSLKESLADCLHFYRQNG